jgi:hypothetical protein
MVVGFASNQTLVAIGSPSSVDIYTDPVPLGVNDRLSCMLDIHSLMKSGWVWIAHLPCTALQRWRAELC